MDFLDNEELHQFPDAASGGGVGFAGFVLERFVIQLGDAVVDSMVADDVEYLAVRCCEGFRVASI